MCASIWAGVQYIDANGGDETTVPLISTVSSRSSASLRPSSSRYGCTCWLRVGGRTHAASSASSGVIHAAMLVANDLPRNGPSGTYSHAWMSRADQSFTKQMPKTCERKSSTPTLVPSVEPTPTTNPTSASISSRVDGPTTIDPSGSRCCPLGRLIGVPLTTTVPARPWYPIGMCSQFALSGGPSGRSIRPMFEAWSRDA